MQLSRRCIEEKMDFRSLPKKEILKCQQDTPWICGKKEGSLILGHENMLIKQALVGFDGLDLACRTTVFLGYHVAHHG